MLCFTDHMTLLDFANYEESALIFHVNTTNILLERFKTSYISLQTRKLVHKIKNDMDIENPSEYLLFPLAVTDALNSACYISSRNAVLKAVYNMAETVSELTVGFLHERVVGWIGGDLCKTFITRFDQWVVHLATILPEKYSTILFIEVGRLMVTLYFNNMTTSYIGNKNLKLSSRGVQQLVSDLQDINVWMVSHISAEHAMDEKNLLLTMASFLVCSQEAALQCYADAIAKFGIQYSLHLYDIIRLVMKFRIDITSRQRKDILGLCGEYLIQLQKAASADSDLLSGSHSLEGAHYFDRSIFEVLCPLAGVEHCTGFKWGVEPLSDPTSVRNTIQNLVTNTCNNARLARLQGLAASIKEKEAQHRAPTTPTSGSSSSSSTSLVSPSTKQQLESPETCDDVLPPASSDVTHAEPTNTSLMKELPATMHTVTVKKKPKPPPMVPAVRPLPPSPPPSTVTVVEVSEESETSAVSHKTPLATPSVAARSPANRPLPPTPPKITSQVQTTSSTTSGGGGGGGGGGNPFAESSVGGGGQNSDKDSSITCSSKSVFSVDTSLKEYDRKSLRLQAGRDPNNPPLSPVIDPSQMERERVINLSFRYSLERDHNGQPLVSGGQVVDRNKARRLPPTPGGTLPTPPTTITFNELESAKQQHQQARASMNEQNLAKLGLKSRPLPPPPPKPIQQVRREAELDTSLDSPVLVELLPIDQLREGSAPSTPVVSLPSEKRASAIPPPKPLKRPSIVEGSTAAAPAVTLVTPPVRAMTPEQALQVLLQKAQEDVLKAESTKN